MRIACQFIMNLSVSQSLTQVNEISNVIMQVTYFLNVLMVNFVFLLPYIERKCFLNKIKLATILFSANALDGNIRILKNS